MVCPGKECPSSLTLQSGCSLSLQMQSVFLEIFGNALYASDKFYVFLFYITWENV